MSKTNPENRISRRLRFRDLQVFFSVVQCRSMAKAANELGVTQPAVSEVVAGLEHAFGVRLFDRTPHAFRKVAASRSTSKSAVCSFDSTPLVTVASRILSGDSELVVGSLLFGVQFWL
jgi:Bacterial regulatory helix-turn-helix protein, lysR family